MLDYQASENTLRIKFMSTVDSRIATHRIFVCRAGSSPNQPLFEIRAFFSSGNFLFVPAPVDVIVCFIKKEIRTLFASNE